MRLHWVATGPVLAQRVDITLSDGRRILVKIVWWDGQGACMFSKRLEKGKFVWPSAKDGKISATPAQLSMLLEGIDWRMPKRTWRPLTTGNLSTNPVV